MKAFLVILVILFFVAAIVFGPLLPIWAVNTLFKTEIEYTFWTWLASIILTSGVLAPKVTVTKS
jgi:hypothetical protein